MSKPDYDTTLARIAGNIAAGILSRENVALAAYPAKEVAEEAMRFATGDCGPLPEGWSDPWIRPTGRA
jgi:hypothetical protein